MILLAVVEVCTTSLAYLTEGRLAVTCIVDTLLGVTLTEISSRGLPGGDWRSFAFLLASITALGGMRMLAVRVSPSAPLHGVDSAPALGA